MAKSLSVRRLSAALIAAATATATAVLVPSAASAAPDPVPPVNTVVGEISLDASIEAFTLSPDGETGYFVTYSSGNLMLLDLASGAQTVESRDVRFVGNVVVSSDSSRVYVVSWGSPSQVHEFDPGTGTFIGTPVHLSGSPMSMALSPDDSRLFIIEPSAAGSTIEVIDTATMSLLSQTYTVGGSARNAVVSPDGNTLYVTVSSGLTEVAVIDLGTSAISTIHVDGYPEELAMSPDGDHVYVSVRGASGAVAVIDTSDNSVTYLGTGLHSDVLALSPDGGTLYLGYSGDTELVTLDIATNVSSVVDLDGVYPSFIGVSPDSATVYTVRTLFSELVVLTYVAPPVTVTFDANGGTGTMAAQVEDEGESVALDANGFTAPSGLVFAGWNTAADGTGTAYLDGADFVFTADTTLYAQWLDIDSIVITGWSSAVEGESVAYTVEGFGPGGASLGDVTPLVTLTSDVASDVIAGADVRFGFVPQAIGGSALHTVTATLVGDTSVSTEIPVTVDSAADSIEVGVPATASQGDTITVAVRALDASGDVLGDASSVAVITSDVATDVVNGLQVTFTHASPHTITAVVDGAPAFTAHAVVEVAPAAAGGLAATGVELRPAIAVVTLLLLGGGMMIMFERRRRLIS